MARHKEGGIELISALPWPIGLVLGIIAFVVARYGIGRLLVDSSNPVLAAMGRQFAQGAFEWIAWALLTVYWVGALLSFIKRIHRKRLLEKQSGIESIKAMSWRQFEMLVGEAFRHQGYRVEENGLGGADGGIDLVLRKKDALTLVQCKQWCKQRVDVRVVREMYGLMTHHAAQAVKIVCVGDFTAEARRFVQDKPIELIHGDALLAMIREAQTASPRKPNPGSRTKQPTAAKPATPRPPRKAPDCPRCGAQMVQRTKRKTGDRFWGCSAFPACRGIRTAQ